MSNIKAFYHLFFILSLTLSFFSCRKEEAQEEIHEIDKKYLSESQLFALNRAIDDDPDNEENYYKRAKVYFDRDQDAKALKDIKKSLDLNNGEGRYFLLQARILESMHQFPEALESAKSAEALKVNQAEVKLFLAKIYLSLDQPALASQYLAQASNFTPYHSEIDFLKGKLAAVNGDTSRAVSHLLATLKKDTLNTGAYKELAGIFFNKHKYDSAMMFAVLGRAIEPEDPFFYYIEGRLLEQVNLKESARTSYFTSLKYDSAFADAYHALAMMHFRIQDLDRAAKYFESELRFRPDAIRSNLYLAEIYEKQNRGRQAIPLLERVLKLDSNNTKAKAALDKLYVLYPKDKAPEPVVKDTVPKPAPTPAPTPAPKPSIKPVPKDTARKKVAPKPKPDTTLKKPAPKPEVPETSKVAPPQEKNNNENNSESRKELKIFKTRKNRNTKDSVKQND